MTTEKSQSVAPVQSIVRRPWEFVCQWYDVDDIHRCITSKLNPVFGGSADIPKDTTSREFAEWLAGEYRLAMRKGAELAASELAGGVRATLLQPSIWITADEREGWNIARQEVERFIDGRD